MNTYIESPKLLCRKCGNRNAEPTGEMQRFGYLNEDKYKVRCPDCGHEWWSVAIVPPLNPTHLPY